MTTTDTDSLQETHRSALASIMELVAPLLDDEAGSQEQDEARDLILEDALSVEVRSGWTTDATKMAAEEFRILLTTGGPAVQIVGTLGQWGTIETAVLQVQDWFKPWAEFATTSAEDEAILTYAAQFYFGE